MYGRVGCICTADRIEDQIIIDIAQEILYK